MQFAGPIATSFVCGRRWFVAMTSGWVLIALMTVSCTAQDSASRDSASRDSDSQDSDSRDSASTNDSATAASKEREVATFGAGCFWCTEAVFERVKGVEKVESGYSGGAVPNPTYQAVCTGLTGHAEVTQVTFDPEVIAYADLLEIFWKTHDPTTLNRQGPDFGTQYRSVVFYHNDQQKKTAIAYKKQLEESRAFKRPIVTEISPFTKFYPAEKYHQDYFERNRRQPYCARYISPKIRKFNRQFKDKLKVQ